VDGEAQWPAAKQALVAGLDFDVGWGLDEERDLDLGAALAGRAA
jgi:hypothetical protein